VPTDASASDDTLGVQSPREPRSEETDTPDGDGATGAEAYPRRPDADTEVAKRSAETGRAVAGGTTPASLVSADLDDHAHTTYTTMMVIARGTSLSAVFAPVDAAPGTTASVTESR